MKDADVQPLRPLSPERNPDSPQSTRRRYWLCTHVYLCTTHNGVVFLDTRRDRYFGLCGIQLHALSLVVEGWPHQPHLIDSTETVSLQDASLVANRYVSAGLLTLDGTAGKVATPVTLDLGRNLVAIGPDVQRHRPLRFRDVVLFVISYAAAAYALRVTSLESIVHRTAERKNHALRSGLTFCPDTAIELVCLFRRMRSFFILGRDRCLFQALALINFLSHYGQFPSWVIGVRTDPWAAHSWVQHGHFVLDSTPETIRFYTPILVT